MVNSRQPEQMLAFSHKKKIISVIRNGIICNKK